MIGEDQEAAYMPRSTAAIDVMQRAGLVAMAIVFAVILATGGYGIYREFASGHFVLKTWIASNWLMTIAFINCVFGFWRSAPNWLVGVVLSASTVFAVAVLWDVEPTFDAYSALARKHWALFAMVCGLVAICLMRLWLFLKPSKSLTV